MHNIYIYVCVAKNSKKDVYIRYIYSIWFCQQSDAEELILNFTPCVRSLGGRATKGSCTKGEVRLLSFFLRSHNYTRQGFLLGRAIAVYRCQLVFVNLCGFERFRPGFSKLLESFGVKSDNEEEDEDEEENEDEDEED